MLRCQAMDIVCTSWDDDVDAKSMLHRFVLTNMATRMNYETAYTCRSMCLSTKIMVEEGGNKPRFFIYIKRIRFRQCHLIQVLLQIVYISCFVMIENFTNLINKKRVVYLYVLLQ